MDYLLKPIDPVELAKTIDRIMSTQPEDYPTKISNLLNIHKTKSFNKIVLTSMEGMVFLQMDQIIRLESDANYTSFYVANNERHLISRPMKDFEDLFNSGLFFRLHQSHIVNLNAIKKIQREDGGYAIMEDGARIPIARRRKDEFLALMKQRFLHS